MKKHLFDLQMFADDAAAPEAADAPATPTEPEKAIDDNKPGTEGEAVNEKKYDDADVDKIIKRKKAEWLQAQEKAVKEAEKFAAMNAEEQANYKAEQEKERADKAEQRIAELEAEKAVAEMTKTARKMFADKGYNAVPDDVLAVLVTSDAAKSKAAIDSFIPFLDDFVENRVKERLRGDVPRAGTAAGGNISAIDRIIKKYE
jgi:hypothetical protein